MFICLLLTIIWTSVLQASHFNGGTITWTPVNPNSSSSSVLITITQSYSYVYPTVSCTTNVPVSSGFGSTNLTCLANCSTQGGYASHPITASTDCTSYSTSLGTLFSQRTVNLTLNAGTYFWIAYVGSAWRSLSNTASSSGGGWSITSLINLQPRPDGLINSPPVVHMSSPQYVIVNTTATITIYVTDANAGDDIRCRWSNGTSPYGIDECSSICADTSLTVMANLSGCTLTFTGTVSNVWYAAAIQVEDYIDTNSTNAMSSVPFQFLIEVLGTPQCSQAPLILNLTDCLDVQVNTPVSFTLYAMSMCNKTQSIISNLQSTVSISGMSMSDLMNSTTNSSLVYVILTWTPQSNQLGSQIFCAVAYTSEMVQSNLYCVTFNVVTSSSCVNASTTGIASIAQTTIIPSASSTINIPFIVVLSLLCFLFTLCCFAYWLCYPRWVARARRRQKNKIKKNLISQEHRVSNSEEITESQSMSGESPEYLLLNEANQHDVTHTSFLSEPAKKISESYRSEDVPNDDTSAVENRPVSQRSVTAITTIRVLPTVSQAIQHSSASRHNEILPMSSPKIYTMRLPNNKVFASSDSHPDIIVKSNEQMPHIIVSNIDDGSHRTEPPAEILAGATLSKTRSNNDNKSKSVKNPRRRAVVQDHSNKKGRGHRVIVVSVKKK